MDLEVAASASSVDVRRSWRLRRRAARATAARAQPLRFDWTDDRGSLGGGEILPFAVFVFIVGSLLIANAWAVVDAKFAVDAATREGVRAFTEAPDEATATSESQAVAHEAIANHGRNPELLRVDPPDYRDDRGFARCVAVTIRAHYPVPAISLPFIGGYGRTFDVTSSHTELIDPYRSGVGVATGGCSP